MVRYLVLINFTEQGAGKIDKSPERAAQFREVAGKAGVKVGEIYWTLGHHDGAFFAEADDEASLTGLMLSLNRAGNVRTSTLRAFNATEFESIVAKIP